MNKSVEKFIRQRLKEGLNLLPDSNHLIFKLMYSHKDLDKDINQVIADMPCDKLDWALTQVENSLEEIDKTFFETFDILAADIKNKLSPALFFAEMAYEDKIPMDIRLQAQDRSKKSIDYIVNILNEYGKGQ